MFFSTKLTKLCYPVGVRRKEVPERRNYSKTGAGKPVTSDRDEDGPTRQSAMETASPGAKGSGLILHICYR